MASLTLRRIAMATGTSVTAFAASFAYSSSKRATQTAKNTWPTAAPSDGTIVKKPSGDIESVSTQMNYLSQSTESSLKRNGKVGTARNLDGSDGELYGVEFGQQRVMVQNARGKGTTMETHGFELLPHEFSMDYYDNEQVLTNYYPEVCELIKKHTGADHVFAFDHNVRSATGKSSGKKLTKGSSVQGPATMVHADYTMTSAPDRLQQLTKVPKANDALRHVLGDRSLISTDEVDQASRFVFINVWRNIRPEPVAKYPLAMCEAGSEQPEDLVTFEIHYKDRIGENYFAKHSAGHRWWYFPRMTNREALMFKTWDSAGSVEGGGRPPMCLHSAFDEPLRDHGQQVPDRESIEVRCVALFK